MDIDLLRRKFEEIGARLKVGAGARRIGHDSLPLTVDVRHDSGGEYFEVLADERQVERIDVIDARPRERHLLLMAATRPFVGAVRFERWGRTTRPRALARDTVLHKPRFLCGHDERHWFTAAVPEAAHASNVRTAMEALKPPLVLEAQARSAIPFDQRFTRKNRAFVRQGEWFFLPRPGLIVPRKLVRRNEPLQRSGGKAHWAEFGYRLGGEMVYVSQGSPQGLTEREYRAHVERHPQRRRLFRIMQRNARLFVRGRVSHPDHATIVLNDWHEVAMNTESQAEARRNVVFLD